jgi:menaquinone-dependent protoporphyrinogen IX oxidase
MPRTRTPEDKLAELEKKQEQIKAQIQKQKAQLRERERKEDTRRKIIVGALALEHMAYDDQFAATIIKLISRHTKPADKELFSEWLGEVPANSEVPSVTAEFSS